MGRYSLSPLASYRTCSAFCTEGRTYGLPFSSRYYSQCVYSIGSRWYVRVVTHVGT